MQWSTKPSQIGDSFGTWADDLAARASVQLEFGRLGSFPSVEIWDKAAGVIVEFFRRTLLHHDIATRLIDLFAVAGLPCPKIFCEVPIGGGTASLIYTWLAEGIRSLLPQLAQMGMATDDLMPIDTLESRLRTATVAARSQVEGLPRSAPGSRSDWQTETLSVVSGKPALLRRSTSGPPMGEYQRE